MPRGKEAAIEAVKNCSDLIREIRKIYIEIITIQPDETWKRLKVYDVPLVGEIYFRPGNIRVDILRIRQNLKE